MIITIAGEPQGKARPRVTRGGSHTYTPKKTKDYQDLIKQSFATQNGHKKQGYIIADIQAYFGIPKSYTKKKRELIKNNEILPSKKPDADNIAKSVLDALNGLAYDDDSQVVDLRITKHYSEEPRVVVYISEY